MASYRKTFRCASAKAQIFSRSIVNAIIGDGGYRGKRLSDTLKATLGCELEVALRPDECPSKFQVMFAKPTSKCEIIKNV